MTTTLVPAVGLLQRAVDYTRGALAGIGPADLGRPTPCRGWDLDRLLWHMDDGLDAFTEASAGIVGALPTGREGEVLDRLRRKACTLLGAWAALPDLDAVEVGPGRLPTDLLVCAGALEISLHGWDVARATGRDVPLPDDLARRLLPLASALITPDDRPARFGAPIEPGPTGSPGARLVAFSGRCPR